MCMFGLSGCRVKPRSRSRRGFTRQPEGSGLQKTPPKFNEKTPREGGKKTKFWAVQGKGGPEEGRSRGRAVPGRAVPGRAVPGRAVPGAPNMTKPKP